MSSFLARWPGPRLRGAPSPTSTNLRIAETASLDLHRRANTLLASVGEGSAEVIEAEGIVEALSVILGGAAAGESLERSLAAIEPSRRHLASEVVEHLIEVGVISRGETRIESDVPPPSGTRVRYLGHSSVLIETESTALVIDPMLFAIGPLGWRLVTRRQGPPPDYATRESAPPALSELPPLSAVAISHSHDDHLDPFTLAFFDKRIPMLLPRIEDRLRADVASLGFSLIRELDVWTPHSVGDIRLTRAPSSPARDAHDRLTDQCTWHVATPDVRVYLATDMSFVDEIFTRVGEDLGVDVAFLPISGHLIGDRRETMDDADALRAARLLSPRVAIPYSGWDHVWLPFTTERFSGSRARFVAEAKSHGVEARMVEPGTSLLFEGGRLVRAVPPTPLSAQDYREAWERATFAEDQS